MEFKVIVAVIILWIAFGYTWFKFNKIIAYSKRISCLASFILFSMIIIWQVVYRKSPEVIDLLYFQVLTWTGSLCLGLWATFMILSLPLDLFYVISRIVDWCGLTRSMETNRRSFIYRGLSYGLLGVASGITGVGYLEVATGAKIKKISIPIRDLPAQLRGLKIVQISDLHIGPTVRYDYVKNVVDQVMEIAPDIIAITGDLADGTPDSLKTDIVPLLKLKAKLGVYYVTGNHEYYWGALGWISQVKHFGFIPLINENRIVIYEDLKVLIGGVTDTSAHQYLDNHLTNPVNASKNGEKCDLRILLAHRPDSCFEAEPCGFNLQLSGHTHGGQFFPWSMFVRFAHRYYKGLNQHGKMWVYVNAGTGYWGPAHRFMVPAEITLLSFV